MRNMQTIPQLLVFAALWVVCASQSASNATSSNATLDTILTSNTTTAARAEKFRCNICGENGAIGNLNGVVHTQFGSLTCNALQGVGNAGAFTDEACPTIQAQVAQDCECNTTAATTPGSSNSTTTPPAQSPAQNPIFTGDATSGNITAASFVCRICGEGKTVGRSAQLLQTPMGTSTCAVLAASGNVGKIAESDCSEIQEIAAASCQCIEGNVPTLPPFQSRAPAAPSSQRFRCPICGQGMMVTDPRGIVTVPSQTQRTCMQLVDLAMAGKIPVAQCVQLQQFTAPCGCEPTSPTPAPFPTVSPSMTPSAVPSHSPSQMPLEPGQTRSPTSMPAVTFESCFDDLSDIHELEKDLQDASVRRKYILCPNTTFALGVVNDEGQIVDGQKMIHLRPNVIYQCGEDGRRSNNCILQGGDFGVVSFYEVFDGISETVDKVVIRGLTFQSQQLFSVVLASAGDVTFDDCAFQVSEFGGSVNAKE
jgi:hypothetical protein